MDFFEWRWIADPTLYYLFDLPKWILRNLEVYIRSVAPFQVNRCDFMKVIVTVAHFIGTASRNYSRPAVAGRPAPIRSVTVAEIVYIFTTDEHGYKRDLSWYFDDDLICQTLPPGQSLPRSRFKVHPRVLFFTLTSLL